MSSLHLRGSLCAIVWAALALAATAQKPVGHELGFKPERLYQFGELDSVNVFNGNLTINVPLGPRYAVGGSLGYEFRLVYNSKMWDFIDWEDVPTQAHWELAEPNLRSNAGVGWRLSLGRLLAPGDTSIMYPSEERGGFVYESPQGDEHPFSSNLIGETGTADADVQFSTDGRLRLVKVDANEVYVEFPNGEKHTFEKVSNRWRLTWQEDRFTNWVHVTYAYDSAGRDATWTITDSAGRSHTVTFLHKTALSDTVAQGQVIDTVTLDSFEGADAVYTFTYIDRNVAYGCGHRLDGHQPEWPDTASTKWTPLLSSVDLPGDTGMFSFEYHLAPTTNCDQGALKRMTLPTGGWTDYTYQQYSLRANECVTSAWGDLPVGIRSKSTSEGATWDYVHSVGKHVQVVPTTCGMNDAGQPIASLPPVRWARTTVLSPATDVTNDATPPQTIPMRTRTDHYFDIWAGGGFDPFLADWAHASVAVFGQRGVLGAPDAAADQNGVTPGPSTLDDIDVRRTVDGRPQWLTSRTYEHCANDRSGNCSAANTVPGRLIRSDYLRWAPWSFTNESDKTTELLGPRLVSSSSTVYDSDAGCGGPCATSVIHDPAQRNGAGLSRQSTFKSNFPGSQDVVTFTNYPSWTAAELRDAARALPETKN
jgi:hypothetical protein